MGRSSAHVDGNASGTGSRLHPKQRHRSSPATPNFDQTIDQHNTIKIATMMHAHAQSASGRRTHAPLCQFASNVTTSQALGSLRSKDKEHSISLWGAVSVHGVSRSYHQHPGGHSYLAIPMVLRHIHALRVLQRKRRARTQMLRRWPVGPPALLLRSSRPKILTPNLTAATVRCASRACGGVEACVRVSAGRRGGGRCGAVRMLLQPMPPTIQTRVSCIQQPGVRASKLARPVSVRNTRAARCR